jgi:hypothetical protein
MGYRSKVVMAIRKTEQTQFAIEAFASATWDSGEPKFNRKEMKDEIVVFVSDGYSIKWYDDDPDNYPGIAKLCSVINELNTGDELEEQYQFIRLGEELDDTEC